MNKHLNQINKIMLQHRKEVKITCPPMCWCHDIEVLVDLEEMNDRVEESSDNIQSLQISMFEGIKGGVEA